jgi:hypothetical protein
LIKKEEKMANEKATKSTAVTMKAYEIASAVADKRKDAGLSSSITAVISEAVVEKFSDEVKA